ncbi:MAG: glycosyltransferase family 2 protein [Oceanospirillaceae bacterium]|nr:glycosyltransferase family 2 protein [Oceanospirillaceae bacterium]
MTKVTKIKVSVVIPAYGRSALLDRAVASVLACPGSEFVEVIIVDDCSPVQIECTQLREQDKLIRLDDNSGAAVCRNVGIESSTAEVISFLDSDDYYIERDFVSEFDILTACPGLYYCSIKSQGFVSEYPEYILLNGFFDCIFYKYPHIGQTSSLLFNKILGVRFDESLPKHQDWDLVLQILNKEIQVKHINGTVYFDRSDQKSLSRKYNPNKSIPWFEKLKYSRNISEVKYIKYNLFFLSNTKFPWTKYFCCSLKYVFERKLRLTKFLRYTVRKIIK